MKEYTILLFYKYVDIKSPDLVAGFVRGLCTGLNLKGRAIIAREGVNITLEGHTEDVDRFCSEFSKQKGFKNIDWKKSSGDGKSFPRLSVKIRPEIVASNLNKKIKKKGEYLEPEDLNRWYEEKEDFVVVDMRNNYEYRVGHFRNSINPGMENFRELRDVLPKLESLKGKKVVTVCTGGVRCEKASGYLLEKGFKEVYQLHGGMHRYMEKFGNKDFLGKLYVFDNRKVTGQGGEHEIVGQCEVCNIPCERYENCADPKCHKHLLICDKCFEKNRSFCSEICKEKNLFKVENMVK